MVRRALMRVLLGFALAFPFGVAIGWTPEVKATGYSYGGYRYSYYPQYGYSYYGASYQNGYYYPAGYWATNYSYTPPYQINVAQFVPYVNTYYVPFATYSQGAAVPAVQLNAVSSVQAQGDPKHDCTAELKAMKGRLEFVEKFILQQQQRPAAVAPPAREAPPQQPASVPQSQAPPQKLDGATVFKDRCLKCHSTAECSKPTDKKDKDGKPILKGGGHDLTAMGAVQLNRAYDQLAKGNMPLDKPLENNEAAALLEYFGNLKTK